ncbi:MAG: CotH kinase family protein, partial [Chitinophagales bacterium]
MENNPSLTEDIHLTINDKEVTGHLPLNAKIDSLIAAFEFLGVSILVNNINQDSAITTNNFSKNVKYEIISESGNSNTYNINTTYFTGLPIMYINTENGAAIASKDEYVEGNIDFFGAKNAESFSSNDIKIRGRGNSSWALFPKKSYQIKFDDKMEIMGMPKDKRWVLLSNYSDKTMLRNKISLDLGQISSLDWTPQSEFVELFLNGHYRGTYLLTQKVEETSNRVDITNDGFLLEVDQLDRLNEEDVYFQSDLLLFNIQAPDVEWEDSEYLYIKEYINEIEDVLYSETFNDPINGYTKYIDVDSFVDWYLINEITKNNDAVFAASVFMNHIPGEKLKMGPIWDFDIALGNIYYNNNDVP